MAVSPAEAAPKTVKGFIGDTALGAASGGLFPGGSARDIAVYTANDSDPANDKVFVVEANGVGDGGENPINRVQRFDEHGNFELMWGKDVIAAGAAGDIGTGYEVCREALSGSSNCKSAPPGDGEGEFNNPHGIAVNQSNGHVYVMDRDNARVQEFDLDGAFVRAWGGPGSAQGEFGPTFADGVGIAVDPVNGDVFVADPGNARVQQFTSEGAFVAAFGMLDDGLSAPGEFGSDEPLRVAVDSSHVVYMSDSIASGRVQRYDADANIFLDPIAAEPTPAAPLVEGTTVGLEIDPDSDGAGPEEEHLLVGRDRPDGDTVVQELDIPALPGDPVTVVVDTHVYEADPSSDFVDSDRTVYGIGLSPSTGSIFLATPTLITGVTGSGGTFTGCSAFQCSGLIVLSSDSGPLNASGVTANAAATSMSVDGVANAGGGVASYRFEISTDGANWQDSGAGGYVSGLVDEPVTGELVGLDPNTLYRVRLVLRKQTGIATDLSETSNELVVLTDAAAPGALTLGSSERTDDSVRLRGRVDPNGAQTAYRFEYGLAGGSFDQHVPIPDASAGSGQSPDLVVADVDGLQPQTTYWYRIVATNFVGTTVGGVITFTTDTTVLPPPPPGRGYELVSPADKVAGVGVGGWYGGPGQVGLVGVAAHERERFAAQGFSGSILTDGAYAYGNDWALAERSSDGWVSQAGTSRLAHGSQNFALMGLQAAAQDLSLSSYNSNGHVFKLFPEMETWLGGDIGEVMIVRDWTSGRWELFGPLDPAQKALGETPIGSSLQEFAADSSAMVSSSAGVRGLAGPGDPTNPVFPDLQSGDSVYLDEVEGGFSDAFPGDDRVRELVNVCTDGTVLPARVDAGGGVFKQGAISCPEKLPGRDARLLSPRGATVESSTGEDVEGVVSADGSRVVFMSPDPRAGGANAPCEGTDADSTCPPQLFVRQRDLNGSVVTRWISRTEVTEANGAAADQDASLMASALFEGASRDGDKVFFRTRSPLTMDDPNGTGAAPAGGVTTGEPDAKSWDLYMYDMPDGPDGNSSTPDGDPAGGDLVRISAGPGDAGDCNSGLSGSTALRFVSADASRAYFTCAAPLPGVPTPDDGTITTPAGDGDDTTAANLYVYDLARPTAQRWRFIARLPRTSVLGQCATAAGGRGGAIGGDKDSHVVLTSGLNCVRGTSDGSLVTFFTDGRLTADDPDAVSGDIYAYDAARDELTRMSAPQGGVGGTYPCATHSPGGGPLFSPPPCYGDPGIESSLGAALHRLGVATRPDGTRLAFFESRSRLVPEDTDETYDVYQWADGELELLSTGGGQDPDGIFYAGNDRSGLNVYLATREQLTWQDKDAVLDVYTARVGGGINEPPPPVDCDLSGDRCQSAGIGPRQPRSDSTTPDGESRAPVERVEISIARPSKRARRRAAQTGTLAVRVRSSGPSMLLVSARARLGGEHERVAATRRHMAAAGTATVKLRFSRAARRRLRTGKALALRVSARVRGTRGSAISVTVMRSGR